MRLLLSLSALLIVSLGAAKVAFPAPTQAFQAPPWNLALDACEKAALQHAPALAAASFDRLSAEKSAASQKSTLLPLLVLDGTAKVVDELPRVSFVPGRPPVEMGDHQNWSVGASLSWTVWDWGALRSAWKSASAGAEARKEAERLTRRQVLLAVRSAYLQVRLAREQVRLLSDSLLLSQAQLRDVRARVSAGTAGALDLSSSKMETLSRRRGLREARAALAMALRDLSNLTGETPPADPSLPLDDLTAAAPPEGIDPPTLLLTLENDASLQRHLTPLGPTPTAAEQPQIRQWEETARSARLQASGANASRFPKIQLTGRSSYEYPNQMELKTVQQNTLLAQASMPLFDAGRASRQSSAARAQAEAAEARQRQAFGDWERDVQKARDQYTALQDEALLDEETAQEAAAFSKRVSESYRSGRSTYLEVESADLKVLQARVTLARTQAQLLLQAAVLRSLTSDR